MLPIKVTMYENKTEGINVLKEYRKNYTISLRIPYASIQAIIDSMPSLKSDFSTIEYNLRDIDAILSSANKEEFITINPLYFIEPFKMELSKEKQQFVLETILPEQFAFIQKNILKRFNPQLLKDFLVQKSEEYLNHVHYAIYVVSKPDEKETLIINTGTIRDICSYVLKNVPKQKQNKKYQAIKEEGFDFSDDKYKTKGITLVEILSYCGFPLTDSIYNLKSTGFEKLTAVKSRGDTGKNIYTLDSFCECIKKSYQNVLKHKINQEKIMPKTGIYKIKELLSMYDVNTEIMSLPTIQRDIRLNRVNYYKFGEKSVRISIADFEEFLDKRTNKYLMKKSKNKGTIELKHVNTEEYIPIDNFFFSFYNRYFLGTKDMMLYRHFKGTYNLYIDSNKVIYLKISDIDDFITTHYGRVINEKFYPKENSYTYKNIGEICSRVTAQHYLVSNTKLAESTIKANLRNLIYKGEIPVIWYSTHHVFIRKEDLKKLERRINEDSN